MKTSKFILTTIFLLGIIYTQAQTPDQQKQLEEAMRMRDSIMNDPSYKSMLKQMQKIKEEQDREKAEREIRKPEAKKKPVAKSNDDWYWNNDRFSTTVSKNNKLPNWTGGEADITMISPNHNNIKIGSIKADGSIVFNLPKKVQTETSLDNGIRIYGHFFDVHDNSLVKYTNKETGFLTNISMPVMRNGKQIGNLSMGNSVRVTYNFIDEGLLDRGDEGYLLYWAYADKSCSMTLDEYWKGTVGSTVGANKKEVKTHVTYNLQFKPGWNLVKTEVTGKYKLKHERGLDVSWYKNHKHTTLTSMPGDARYYFRKNKY